MRNFSLSRYFILLFDFDFSLFNHKRKVSKQNNKTFSFWTQLKYHLFRPLSLSLSRLDGWLVGLRLHTKLFILIYSIGTVCRMYNEIITITINANIYVQTVAVYSLMCIMHKPKCLAFAIETQNDEPHFDSIFPFFYSIYLTP